METRQPDERKRHEPQQLGHWHCSRLQHRLGFLLGVGRNCRAAQSLTLTNTDPYASCPSWVLKVFVCTTYVKPTSTGRNTATNPPYHSPTNISLSTCGPG